MSSTRKIAVAVSTVALAILAGHPGQNAARGQNIIDRNATVNNLNLAGAWTPGTVPGANDVARFTSGSVLTNTLGANLTFGGLRVTDVTGSLTLTGNTLTVGRYGIDMSSAAQDLTIASALTLQGGFKQTWNVGAGRTVTYSGAMFNSNNSNGSVLIAGSGAVRLSAASISPNDLVGPGTNLFNGNFVVNGGRDFAGVNASGVIVPGLTTTIGSTRYTANPASGTNVPSTTVIPVIFNFTNFNDNVITGFRVPGANIFPNGWLFNTPVPAELNPNNRDWVVDASSSATVNRQLGGATLGVLVGPDVTNNVTFLYSAPTTVGQGGSGFRMGNQVATFPLRNYSTAYDLNVNVQVSVGSGGTGSMTTSGPGRVNFGNGIFLNSGGNLIVNEGTTQFVTYTNVISGGVTSGSFSTGTGSIIVNGGTLLFNTAGTSVTARPVFVNSGASFGGTGSSTGAISLAGGAFYSPGTAGVDSGSGVGVGTQTVGSMLINSGAALRFDFASTTSYDRLIVANSLGLDLGTGGINSIPVTLFDTATSGTFNTEGVYTLFSITGGLGGAGLASNFAIQNPDPSKIYTFSGSANAINLTIAASAPVATYWTADTNGVWGNNANWSAAFPDGPSKIAAFGPSATFTGSRVVTLDAGRTVGQLLLTSATPFTIAPATPGTPQVLTLDNGISSASVEASGAAHTISAPIALNADGALFNVSSSLLLSNTVSGGPLAKAGPGTLTLASDNNNLTALSSGAGTTAVTGTANALGNVNVTGGVTMIGKPGNTVANVNVTGGTLQIGDGVNNGTLPTGTVTVGPAGTLEFKRPGDNEFFIQYPLVTGTVAFTGGGLTRLNGSLVVPNGTIRISAGDVRVDNSTAFNGGSAPDIGPNAGQNVVLTGGTLNLNANNVGVGTLTGTAGNITDLNSSGGVTTLTQNGVADGTYAGTITDGPNRQVAVVKISPNTANSVGIWTLSGSNNFSGGLLVRKGDVLALNEKALGTGPITIAAAGTNASARARVGIGGSYTITNDILVRGLNTFTGGAIFVINATDNVVLTGSLQQDGDNGATTAIGAGTSRGGTVQGPNGTGLLTIAGPILASSASDPDIGAPVPYPLIINANNQGNVRFAYPGGGPVGATTGQIIINTGNISLGVNDGMPVGAEVIIGDLGSGQATIDLRGFDQTLRRLTKGAGSGATTVTNSQPTRSTFTLASDIDSTIPTAFSGNLNLTLPTSQTTTFSGNLTLTGSISLTAPNGRIVFNNNLRPVTGSLVVTGAGSSALITGTRSSTAYTTVLNVAGITAGAAGANATVSIAPTDRTSGLRTAVGVTGTLDIAAGSFVDLANNDLIVTATSTAALNTYVRAWRNSVAAAAAPTGLGSSSTADGIYATLAVFPNAAGDGISYFDTYDGVAVASTSNIVKYTYVGDLNLDGTLTSADFVKLLEGLTTGATGYHNGDINYDGVINGADLTLFNQASAALGTASLGNGLGGGDAGTGGSIPEPGSLGLLLAAAPLLSRRRR